ncbi:hypothetical protein ACFLYJ_00840 [Candidatus Cloacimonadota bacterium]
MKVKIRNRFFFSLTTFLFLVLFVNSCSITEADNDSDWPSATENVNGEILDYEGFEILKLWGTNYEQGYAYGYLKAPSFVEFAENYLADPVVNFDIEIWETGLGMLDMFNYPADYESELQGFLDGLETRAGEPIFLDAFQRNLSLNDLKALQSDLDKIQCSSFTAWGNMTSDGNTITGRNMDQDLINAMMATQFIIARIPDMGSGKLGWVSVNWPGEIGCTTGMNEDGVTVSQQDVYRYPPTAAEGFTPDNLLHRMIIESAQAGSVIQEVENILQNNYVATGCAPMISWPYNGSDYAAIVPEFDGKIGVTNGFTIRYPESGLEYIISANHFREREIPMGYCWRYNLIESEMQQIASSNGNEYLTVGKAWEILVQTPIPEMRAMHSVVFETNNKLIHIAFTENGIQAPGCTNVTLNIEDILSR